MKKLQKVYVVMVMILLYSNLLINKVSKLTS